MRLADVRCVTLALVLCWLFACGGSGGGSGGGGGPADGGSSDISDVPDIADIPDVPDIPDIPDIPEVPDPSEICNNEFDDDGDGLIDCADIECLAGASSDLAVTPLSFAGSIAWLHAPDAIASDHCVSHQQEPDEGVIDSGRVAVIRGTVSLPGGGSFEGAHVRVTLQDELGATFTRADGVFDIVVNGGGAATIEVTSPGYLPVQRTVRVRPLSYAWVDPIVLTPISAISRELRLGDAEMQTLEMAASQDESGYRQPILMIPAGTTAVVQSTNGSVDVDRIDVRLTEYTVGPDGPAAMPANLPPLSAYTYAFELTADQVDESQGEQLRFDQPVPIYLENFLDFPTGIPVPVGYYDRERRAWEAQDDGIVLTIVGVSDGLADLDIDGDQMADSPSALDELGVNEEERRALADRYESGQSLWRFTVSHFSPWDCNWPFRFPDDAIDPPRPPPIEEREMDAPTCADGSIIRVENQSLSEIIRIPGTSHTLHYGSHRSLGGQRRTIDILVSNDDVPASLRRIEVMLDIAGRRVTETYDPLPNQRFRYEWDGLDAYGRRLQGQHSYRVSVRYVYPGVYGFSRRGRSGWGLPAEISLDGNRTREELYSTRTFEVDLGLGGYDARPLGLGGLTLGVHHVYDSKGRTLFLGDGRRRTADSLAPTLEKLVEIPGSTDGYEDLVPHPDGSILVSYRPEGPGGSVVLRYEDGQFTTYAGGGSSLGFGWHMALGPDDSLYIAESHQIRKIGLDGIISTVAGGGTVVPAHQDDGQPASESLFWYPAGLSVAPDETLFLSDNYMSGLQHNPRIHMITPDGILWKYAGGGTSSQDGMLATESAIGIGELQLDDEGNLYYLGRGLRRIGLDGTLRTIIAPCPSDAIDNGDGGMVSDACTKAWDFALHPDGSIVLGEPHGMRVVAPDGFVDTVPGTSDHPHVIRTVAVDRHGAILGIGGNGLFRLSRAFDGASFHESAIASEDGSRLFAFDRTGRHDRTIDTFTGGEIHRFEYDGANRLSAVVTNGVRRTRFERDGMGRLTAIVSPEGLRTLVRVGSNGYIERLENPAEETIELDIDDEGLLVGMVDARSGAHRYRYLGGRLVSDRDPSGSTQTLERETEDGWTLVTRTTGSRRVIDHRRRARADDSSEVRVEDQAGLIRASIRDAHGNQRLELGNGMVIETRVGPDPRFGALTPLEVESLTTLPSGLQMRTSQARTVELSDPTDPLSLVSWQETWFLNGSPGERSYDPETRTMTERTPPGRMLTRVFDEMGRLSAVQLGQLSPVSLHYDDMGRLAEVVQGEGADARRTLLDHNAQGFLEAVTNSNDETTRFGADPVGRMTSVDYPDLSQLRMSYDPGGGVASLTPPGKTVHQLNRGSRGLLVEYVPPEVGDAGPTTFVYDEERRLATMQPPGLAEIDYLYDAAGRLETVMLPEGLVQLRYGDDRQLVGVSAPTGVDVALNWDGPLLRDSTWSGAVQGRVTRSYDQNLNMNSLAVNGVAIPYHLDLDGYVRRAGDIQIVYAMPSGLLSSATIGWVQTELERNEFGDVFRQMTRYGNHLLFQEEFGYDSLGRVTEVTETVFGEEQPRTYGYTYDERGRLTEVRTDGQLTHRYKYDDNGNRTLAEAGSTSASASYDEQDRLLAHGSYAYAHTARGTRETKRDTSTEETTRYVHDSLGNLTSVVLPDGTEIEYVYDGFNRRVQKRVNDQVAASWLYQDGLNPVAELDASGTVVTRFVYGTRGHVPDYMIRNGEVFRIITDARGSARMVINRSNGQITQIIYYGPFGEVYYDSTPGYQPFGFAGGLYDTQTGLVHFGARDYDPEVGRWISKDPVLFVGGQTNLYTYVDNDPVSLVDPSGLWKVSVNAYYLIGGGFGVGQNENGSWFLHVDTGIGIGAGFGYSSDANSPTYGNTSEPTFDAASGFFEGEASVGLGPTGATLGSYGISSGAAVTPSGVQLYTTGWQLGSPGASASKGAALFKGVSVSAAGGWRISIGE